MTAGLGLFNEWYQPWVYEQTLQLDGTHLRDVIIRDPGYPNPLGGEGVEALPPPSIIRESADGPRHDVHGPRRRWASSIASRSSCECS